MVNEKWTVQGAGSRKLQRKTINMERFGGGFRTRVRGVPKRWVTVRRRKNGGRGKGRVQWNTNGPGGYRFESEGFRMVVRRRRRKAGRVVAASGKVRKMEEEEGGGLQREEI